MNIFGKMGQGLCGKTFARHKKKAIIREQQKVDNVINTHAVIYWIDNFSKYFKKSFLNMQVGPYMLVDWTPLGMSKMPGSQARDLLHKLDTRTGTILPAFQPQILRGDHITELLQHFSTYDNFQKLRHWRTSVGTLHQVFNTPLRMEAGNLTQEELIFGSNVGLRNFHPIDLLSENVGTNYGLCRSLRALRNRCWKPGHYLMLKVDVDLYWRICRVSLLFLVLFKFKFSLFIMILITIILKK